MTTMAEEDSIQSTPTIHSTAPATTQNEGTATQDEANEPSIVQFQNELGLDSMRLQSPMRYIEATTC